MRGRTLLVMPAVLLTMNLLEEVVTYLTQRHVRDLHVRVAAIVLLNGAAFAIGGEWITPLLTRVLTTT
jgi:hypothetical protein